MVAIYTNFKFIGNGDFRNKEDWKGEEKNST